MRTFSNLGLAALIIPIVSVGTVVGTGATANAVDCSVHAQDNSGAHATVRSDKTVRRGPSTHCAIVGQGSGRYNWNLNCWVFNSAGNVWWHGTGTDGTGWVREDWLVNHNNVRNIYNKC